MKKGRAVDQEEKVGIGTGGQSEGNAGDPPLTPGIKGGRAESSNKSSIFKVGRPFAVVLGHASQPGLNGHNKLLFDRDCETRLIVP